MFLCMGFSTISQWVSSLPWPPPLSPLPKSARTPMACKASRSSPRRSFGEGFLRCRSMEFNGYMDTWTTDEHIIVYHSLSSNHNRWWITSDKIVWIVSHNHQKSHFSTVHDSLSTFLPQPISSSQPAVWRMNRMWVCLNMGYPMVPLNPLFPHLGSGRQFAGSEWLFNWINTFVCMTAATLLVACWRNRETAVCKNVTGIRHIKQW